MSREPVVRGDQPEEERQRDAALRPRWLREVIGQKAVLQRLRISLNACRKLKEPIGADSPFMIAWWDSPTPVDPDFIRRQRKDAAAIPLRVWLAVLDQGLPGDAYADLQSTLPRLKAPTLLIWGSRDPIVFTIPKSADLKHVAIAPERSAAGSRRCSSIRWCSCPMRSIFAAKPSPRLPESARHAR